MILIPVKSSNISAAGHENNTLRIQFSNGTEYDYKDVSSETFNDFMESESQGKFFHKNIKGKFSGTKNEKGSNDG